VVAVARTGVCVDCVCIDVEMEEEEGGGGACARFLPREEPPVAAFANSSSGVDVIHRVR